MLIFLGEEKIGMVYVLTFMLGFGNLLWGVFGGELVAVWDLKVDYCWFAVD